MSPAARAAEPKPRFAADTPAADLSLPLTAARALAVFFRIAERWGLTPAERQALLGVSRTVYYRWQAGQVQSALDGATAERLSYLFRIYAALQVLLPIAERADAWIRQPNTSPLFGGSSALARMLGGRVGDLKDVADFLDARRGGDFA
jgi:Protein of unknown function (DUF2384)